MIFDGTNYDPIIVKNEDGSDTGWRIVGTDPRQWQYSDEDQEVMDFTNWDVLKGGMGEDTEYLPSTVAAFRIGRTYDYEAEWDAWMSDDEASWMERDASEVIGADAYDYIKGYNLGSNSVLIIREAWEDGEETEEWAHYLDCAKALSDYPLLDESGYSELEHEAWNTYYVDTVRGELARIVAIKLGANEGEIDAIEEALVDNLTDAMDEAAHQGMAYYYGFSGEYDEEGAVSSIVAWWESVRTALDVMAELGRYAMLDGQKRLTFT